MRSFGPTTIDDKMVVAGYWLGMFLEMMYEVRPVETSVQLPLHITFSFVNTPSSTKN